MYNYNIVFLFFLDYFGLKAENRRYCGITVMESSTQLPSTSTAKKLRVRVLILKNVLEYEYRKKLRVRVLLQV